MKYIIVVTSFFICRFSYAEKSDTLDLFNRQFVDSIENYVLLNQNDLILKLYIEINPFSNDFVSCLNCKENELEFLNIKQIKNSFFRLIDKSDCESLMKTRRYLIEINSIGNYYNCKLLN